MADDFTFETPPPRNSGRHNYATPTDLARLLEMARSQPGVWVKKPPTTSSATSGTYIRRRYPDFETTTRFVGNTADGRRLYTLYVRYVGGED